MRCKLRVGEWAVEAEVDDPGASDWSATVLDAPRQLEPGQYTAAWLGPNGEPGTMVRVRVEGRGGRAVLHGRRPLR